jgi:uncharacterized protein
LKQDELFLPKEENMYLAYIFLGLAVGIMVGFMGIGGGVVLVPALVHLLHMDQHTAQGTSLFMQLPPLGLGALVMYWKKKQVDLRAGVACALGMLLGGYFGSKMAIHLASKDLRELFGLFLIVAASLLWHRPASSTIVNCETNTSSWARVVQISLMACVVGVAGGMFGLGGGVLLVPLLVIVFGFEQHCAQGTSLVALVPPTGLLAFLNYASTGKVSWTVGLWLMPGVFFGAMAGSRWAQRLSPEGLRRVVAVVMVAIGVWETYSAWRN